MNRQRLDLNLLHVFDAVMRERSVTRAARLVGLTQPATSNALRRLRHALGDELFVWSHGEMRPTPRALELAEGVNGALTFLSASLQPKRFAPREEKVTFNLAMTDQAAIVLLPRLVSAIAQEAPSVDLRIRPKVDAAVYDQLDQDEVDLGVGVFEKMPTRFQRKSLFADDYVCVMRCGHPLSRSGLTQNAYSSAEHVLVRPTGEISGHIDSILTERGFHRRIAVTVHQVLAIPLLVEKTDLIATIFRTTAEHFSRFADVRIVELPVEIGPVEISLVWHRSMAEHPPLKWLRSVIAGIAEPCGGACAVRQ